jgi:hypothetical protein
MIFGLARIIVSMTSLAEKQSGRSKPLKQSLALSSTRRHKMAQRLKAKGRALADAVLRLSQYVHQHYPQAVLTMLAVPYTDEDLTIDVALPEGVNLREVSDDLIRMCLTIEDELGISILTQTSRLTTVEETAR